MKTKRFNNWNYQAQDEAQEAVGSYESKKAKLILYIILLVLTILGNAIQEGFSQSFNAYKTSVSETKLDINYRVKPERLNAVINSKYNELKPLITPDGKTLYFTRQFHPDNTGGTKDFEDIWYCELNEITNTWGVPKKLESPINNAGPNFLTAMCFTSDTLFLGNEYRKKGKMRAGLSMSVRHEDQWSQPRAIDIPHDLNRSPQVSYFVSMKRGIMMMSMDRIGEDGSPDSFGERDLYISFMDGLEVSEPVNLGPVINTVKTESAPYLAPDGKTLFFASNGRDGFGGLDLYVSTRLDDTWQNWSEPKNLGPFINSDNDDEFFSFTMDGHYAYFSREFEAEDSDIYRVKLDHLFGLEKAQELANVTYDQQYIELAKQKEKNKNSLFASL